MELLLIPVLLVTGAALFHLGVNGAPSMPNLAPALSTGPLFSSHQPTPPRSQFDTVDLLAFKPDEDKAVELSDALLAELLSEMIELRQQVQDLKAQVESATSAAVVEQAPQPASRPARKSSARAPRAQKPALAS